MDLIESRDFYSSERQREPAIVLGKYEFLKHPVFTYGTLGFFLCSHRSDESYTLHCVFKPDHDLRPPLFIHLQFFFLHFTDIDECQNKSSNDCEQLCVNIPASFFCDCRDGYKLKVDGLNCDGKTLALPCSLFMFEARWCLKSSYWPS